MSKIKRIGLDTSKAVFTLHCVDESGRVVLRTNLRRAQMVTFFKNLAPAEIALEACGGSHHWARELAALGHEVRLIPPQYVKPFVKLWPPLHYLTNLEVAIMRRNLGQSPEIHAILPPSYGLAPHYFPTNPSAVF